MKKNRAIKKKIIARGKKLAYPMAKAIRYANTLKKLIRQMTAETQARIKTLFSSPEAKEHFAMDEDLPSQAKRVLAEVEQTCEKLLNSIAVATRKDFVDDVDEYSTASMQANIKALGGAISVKTGIFPTVKFNSPKIRAQIKASANENTALIKSIPREYLGKVSKVVSRSIASGSGADEIYQHVKQYAGVTERRAQFIAEDQTRKVYNGLNAKRMTSAGLDEFEWLHSGGGMHPRPFHEDELNGEVFKVSDPPVIDDDTGETGIPGDLPNCRCTMIPVVTAGDDNEDSE